MPRDRYSSSSHCLAALRQTVAYVLGRVDDKGHFAPKYVSMDVWLGHSVSQLYPTYYPFVVCDDIS